MNPPTMLAVMESVAWQKFVLYCQQLKHGELEKLKIADGVPQIAEKVTEKVRFT